MGTEPETLEQKLDSAYENIDHLEVRMMELEKKLDEETGHRLYYSFYLFNHNAWDGTSWHKLELKVRQKWIDEAHDKRMEIPGIDRFGLPGDIILCNRCHKRGVTPLKKAIHNDDERCGTVVSCCGGDECCKVPKEARNRWGMPVAASV